MFNELYYAGMENPDLKAEDAWLCRCGIAGNKALDENWTLGAKADGFYNFLKNKIVSAPSTTNPAVWLPLQWVRSVLSGLICQPIWPIGQGIGRLLSLPIIHIRRLLIGLDSKSATYGQQIPYIAKHTMSLVADGMWRTWKQRLFGIIVEEGVIRLGICRIGIPFDLNLTKTSEVFLSACICATSPTSTTNFPQVYPLPGFSALAGVAHTLIQVESVGLFTTMAFHIL